MKHPSAQPGIPVSVSLDDISQSASTFTADGSKKRMFFIAGIAVLIAACVSVVAKLLIYLINLVTNLSFHHQFSFAASSPGDNSYGVFVVLVPVAGGVIVGLMALYGSKAIRGHGIPEAMEQILTNKSKIKPSITYLKPLSSAISIGTGGPFGAEGPIIATGGALGSTLGQLLRITHYERKVLLAAGATAGMSAIFGTPIAAIFLAIELLLFEFSPASIIPVALACITGSAGHHLLFESGPVFPMPAVSTPGNPALMAYSLVGVLMGLLSAGVTKIVYGIEDFFEHIPVHWMWWPAIGGVAVGVIGYFVPATLGVGYDNITAVLSGKMITGALLTLCIMKFISWSVALGSGTSGGTLAPLLTIGGAAGALIGWGILAYFPDSGVSIPLAALTGMAAMFAGASRALLTSIMFAIEATDEANALLPLLAACVASYIISYFLMENTIMTEKIARRGIRTPHAYHPDVLEKLSVEHVLTPHQAMLNASSTLEEVRHWLNSTREEHHNYYIVVNDNGFFKGIISFSSLMNLQHPPGVHVGSIIRRKPFSIELTDTLKTAAVIMAKSNLDVLPVTNGNNIVIGILTYKDILSAYHQHSEEHEPSVSISVKRRTLKALLKRRKRIP
ncbi:MAG TPA: chloride channel protein [Chitinophagaceae bacterium]